MKQRIISQITKSLNITEEYLANYIGITHKHLEESKLNNRWEGKIARLYRLNSVIYILKNQGFKGSSILKNILDNKRYQPKDFEDDISYISMIISQENLSEFIKDIVFDLKVGAILKAHDISIGVLCNLMDCTESKLQEKRGLEISLLYRLFKKVNIKDSHKLSFLVENYQVLNGLSLISYVLMKKEISFILKNIETIKKEFEA